MHNTLQVHVVIIKCFMLIRKCCKSHSSPN